MALDHSTIAWLIKNRDHRMDALDAGGIFFRDRQAFHCAKDDGRYAGELRRQADVGAESAKQLAWRGLPVPQCA